jgi:hypothetical protein
VAKEAQEEQRSAHFCQANKETLPNSNRQQQHV